MLKPDPGISEARTGHGRADDTAPRPVTRVRHDGKGRFVTAVLHPAKRPRDGEIRTVLRRLLRTIRASWPHLRLAPEYHAQTQPDRE
ncbi:MAG: hypothetical protein HWD60_05980 [Defluviicoccus sp.]|nr:MAG: hypothetical protein HWD60_05980 [Defluviicoccus sp.]